jgi:hypothetical protein
MRSLEGKMPITRDAQRRRKIMKTETHSSQVIGKTGDSAGSRETCGKINPGVRKVSPD